MYTLKGIFPEPKKEQKKNFIRENMKQLKYIQGKSPKESQQGLTSVPPRIPRQSAVALSKVKSSASGKSGKAAFSIGKSIGNPRKKLTDVRIKKGDMAEFLERKERRAKQVKEEERETEEEDCKSSESSGCLRDIGCQTIESTLAQQLTECTKLTVLYPKKEDEEAKLKASGDSSLHNRVTTPKGRKGSDEMNIDSERNRSRLNAILERKDKDNKDPYLPSGYQRGVVPAYLRARREGGAGAAGAEPGDECPAGHVALPDQERKETLRMLRNSFAELVSELNKMPVKTDTLRMRNRKMELEKQLAKLEEGIKVFSRPKVFVKIGE
ncbi:enkurin domain-containing protein 1-like [Cydia fagiglandana]|uniref:enkurin domain-containing protein 1-like n=1 Tax=Cydia fagiglandana TaxID=1458189 RepID=UPI002FEE2CDE